MPDISMCKGKGCPLKNKCYRHKAKPCKYMQSYFCEVPYSKEEKKCVYFWEHLPRRNNETVK